MFITSASAASEKYLFVKKNMFFACFIKTAGQILKFNISNDRDGSRLKLELPFPETYIKKVKTGAKWPF